MKDFWLMNDVFLAKPTFRRPRDKDKQHLLFVSTLPCIHTGSEDVQVCHLRTPCLALGKRYTGKAEKPDDRFVLPMTPELHAKQHSMNEIRFWEAMSWTWQDVVQLALDIYENTGDEEACKSLIARARR